MFFEFNDISYSYGQSIALDSLSFFALRGEIVGLIGENGAGKTTAVKTIVRFIKPEHGTISINGTDIQKIKLEQYPVSYIPDTPVFYEELSLLEHLQFVKALFPDIPVSIEDTIVRFDLQEHCNKVPAALSKGTQQKLSIAMALLRSFDILVADEPFTGLDPTQIAVLKDCLLEVKQAGKLVLLSSHLLSVVENICDRYVIIKKGKLLAAGTRKALMHQSNLPDSTSMETLYLKLVNNHEKNSK